MACTLLPVSYPAHSVAPIGDFNGGDCVITLSDARLSISSHDGHLIATWRYCTIRSFNCSSTDFCFVSGRRGPYGVQEYTFNVSPLVMMMLFSVLSKITGVKIERDFTTTNCSNQPGDSIQSSDQSLSSNCYKVANSTFYIDIQSDSTDGTGIDYDQTPFSSFLTPSNVSGHKEDMHRGHLIPLVIFASSQTRPPEDVLPVQPLTATLPTQEGKVADSRGSPDACYHKKKRWQSADSKSGITSEYRKLTTCLDLSESRELDTHHHSLANRQAHPITHPPNEVRGVRAVTAGAKGEGKGAACIPLVGHPFMSDANGRQPRTTIRGIDAGATALASLEPNLHSNDEKKDNPRRKSENSVNECVKLCSNFRDDHALDSLLEKRKQPLELMCIT